MVDRITHVSVRNYKSLAEVDVDLGPLTVLVGPNGAGKSNFVDALRFVSYSLWLGLDVQIVRNPQPSISASIC
jgi:AAA15 family ATPase/GTPase